MAQISRYVGASGLIAGLALCVGAGLAQPSPTAIAPSSAQSALSAPSAQCIPAWIPFEGMDDIDSSITSSAVGSDGFLYLGGASGLYRIEGKRVRKWLPDPNDPTSIPSGAVTALQSYEDAIWIGSRTGLTRFDIASGAFTTVPLSDEFPSDPPVQSLFLSGGMLLVGTIGESVFRLDPSRPDETETILLENAAAKPAVFGFAEFDGRLIAATRTGLEVIGSDGSARAIDGVVAPEGAEAIVEGPQGNLWVGAQDALYEVTSLAPLAYERYAHEDYPALPNSAIDGMTFDDMGRLWVGGENGLARWDFASDAPINCRRDRFGKPDRTVALTFLSTDIPGKMLMGTRGAQLKVANLATSARRIVTGDARYSNLPRASIWSTLVGRDGRLMLGTSQGLYRESSPGEDTFERVFAGQLGERRVSTLYETADEELWIGTNRGLFVLAKGQLEQVPLIVDSTGQSGRENIYQIVASGERLVLGSPDGLIILDRALREVIHLFHKDESEKPVNGAPTIQHDRATYWHASTSENSIYGSGSSHVHRFDPETGKLVASTDEARASGVFTPGRIYGAVPTASDEVVIGTDNGIAITDPDFEKFEFLDRLHGKRMGGVRNLVSASDGQIWMSTGELGLLRFDPESRTSATYSVQDGLHSAVTTQGALSVSRDGTVTSATGIGATVIRGSVQPVQSSARTTLVAFHGRNQRPITGGSSITLEPDDRRVSIDLAVPEILEQDRYWVQYSFSRGPDPLQSTITDLDQPLSLQYLEPGNYAFSGQVVSASGPVSEPLEFEVVVLAYWWERQSTYALALIFIAALVAAGFYYRTRSIERKFQIIADERRRIAQELHDSSLQDLFGAQMLGRTLKVDGSADNAETQKGQVLDLLKSATSSMRESVMTLRESPETPTLSEAIGEFEPPAALSSPVELSYSEDGSKWSVGKYRRFFVARIAQEAINNAAKHARAGSIKTKLSWSFWNLVVEITDDGGGFDTTTEEAHAGHGREAMQCMADAVSGTLETHSAVGKGTTIRLKVPRFSL